MSTTPNMSLVLPDASSTVGPTYAQLLTNLGGAFYSIDSHNHAPGYGVQVPTAGLNINANLSAGGYAITALYATAYNDLGTTSSMNRSLYFNGRDLYVKDGNGSAIQMTASGSIAGATGSISGLSSPATAAYSSVTKTFTWNQDSNYRAHMDFASAILHRGAGAAENSITLIPPAGLAGSYTITMPGAAASGTTGAVAMDTSGTLSVGDVPTDRVVTASIKDLNVTTGKLADSAVTTAKIAAGNVTTDKLPSTNTSTANVNVTGLSSGTLADVTGASVSLTTNARPIAIGLRGAASDGVNAYIALFKSGSGTVTANLAVLVDGTIVAETFMSWTFSGSANVAQHNPVQCIIVPATAAAHTIKLQYKVAGGTIDFNNMVWYATEL